MKKKISLLITALMCGLLLFSCIGKRKVAKMNNALANQKHDEIAMQQKLMLLDSVNDLKKRKGETDDSAATNLKTKLNDEISASKLRNENINKVAATLKRGMRRKQYKNAVVFNTNGKNIITEKKEDVFLLTIYLNSRIL
jgi:hypothetical protein